jgi:hypothetical protein
MANLPKGNSIALQALRPSEFKVADFIDDKITNYIKDGRAAEAARIKRLQDEGKQLMDINKDIKITSITSIPPVQKAINILTKDTMDAKAYGGRIANDYNIPYSERAEANRIAQAKADNLILISQHLSDPNFIKQYNEKLATDPATVFEGDDTLHFINAIAGGDIKLKFDENGNILVAYPDQNQKPDDPVEWKDFADLAARLGQGFEKDKTAEIEDLAKQQASNLYSKFEENKTGNVKISGTKFLKDEASASFENTFGGYDINNKDSNLRQFSYSVLGKKFINSQEDYDKVKQAWVDKLESYTPKESSYIVEKSPAELRNLELRNRALEKEINKPDPQPASASSKVSVTQAGGIVQIDGAGKGRLLEGGTLFNLNNKEYIAGYKVKNSNNNGYHTEYSVLGRDEQGRLSFKEKTTRGDVAIRLSGYKIDPIMVENVILSGAPAKINPWKAVTSKNLKSFNQAKEDNDSESDLLIVRPVK